MSEIPKRIYLFIGPPGSGKGTLSNFLVRKYSWVQLSTGDLLRKHIAEQTDIGKQIDFAIKSGKLVSDSLVNAMVEHWLVETLHHADNIILDGYPRTLAQAASFSAYLSSVAPAAEIIVVKFAIPDEAVVERISGRLICQNKECQKVYSALEYSDLAPKRPMICDVCGSVLGKRKDDVGPSVHDRIREYHKHEQALLKFYVEHGYNVHELPASKTFDEVFSLFQQVSGVHHS